MKQIRLFTAALAILGSLFSAEMAEAKTLLWSSKTQDGTAKCEPESILKGGDALTPGEELWSADHNFVLIMQKDGNLVLYKRNGPPIWASETDGVPVEKAILEISGNLVLYDSSGHPRWSSNTFSKKETYLAVQCDGNVAIYEK